MEATVSLRRQQNMGRMKFIGAALLLALVMSIAVFASAKEQPPQPGSDDAQVIDTALLSLYENTDANRRWTRGDFVLVRPAHDWNKRADFDTALGRLISRIGTRKTARELSAIRNTYAKAKASASATPEPLTSMRLDERIVLEPIDGKRHHFTYPLTNASGRKGSVRLSGEMKAPSYSPDGTYAICEMNAYFSIHSGRIVFLLHRNATGWSPVLVSVLDM